METLDGIIAACNKYHILVTLNIRRNRLIEKPSHDLPGIMIGSLGSKSSGPFFIKGGPSSYVP